MRAVEERAIEQRRTMELLRENGRLEGILAEHDRARLANPAGDFGSSEENGDDVDEESRGSYSDKLHDAVDAARDSPGRAVAGGLVGASSAALGAAAAGAAGSAVGTIVAAGTIYVVEHHRESGHAALLGAAVAGCLVTGIAALGGSLTGRASLGAPIDRLKWLARNVQLHGLAGLAEPTVDGLGLRALAGRLNRAVSGPSLTAALAEARNLGRTLADTPGRPSVHGSEDYSTSGWKWSPN